MAAPSPQRYAALEHGILRADREQDREATTGERAKAAGKVVLRVLLLASPALLFLASGKVEAMRLSSSRLPEASRRERAETQLYYQRRQPGCLCLFDVDRTLTGKQNESPNCPGTLEMNGMVDTAFGGGPLVLSDLARNLGKTFCGKCYRGIITVGPASGDGSAERQQLTRALGGPQWTLGGTWSTAADVHSMLVTAAADQHKQETARLIVEWARKQGAKIPDDEVYFFDDNVLNPPPFEGSGFNAIQVSCQSRERNTPIGWCGGLASEVVRTKGVKRCA